MIYLLGCGDPTESVKQTVKLSTLTGTMEAHHGLDRDIQLDDRTDLHVFARGGITAARHRSDILEPIVKPHAGTIGDAFILTQDNAIPTQFGCSLPPLMTSVSM